MNVVLIHPVHGAKVAICDEELKQDEKNGWEMYAPEPAKKTRKVKDDSISEKVIPPFLDPTGDDSNGV